MRPLYKSYSLVACFLCSIAVGSAQQPQSVNTLTVVPKLVHFAGSFHSFGESPAGPVGATFAIYSEQEGGAPLWTEDQNVELDANGNYTVLLGATKNAGVPPELFAAGEARWLQVKFYVPSEVDLPRVLLVSVPYAMKASDADTLGGKPASAFALAAAADHGPVTESATGSGEAVQPAFGDRRPGLTGYGTANYIPIWKSTNTIGNSNLFQAGGNVGIGTQAPGSILEVDGNNGQGIISGYNAATSGYGNGVYGQSASPNGSGVAGLNYSTSGGNGVYGQTVSPEGNGVNGVNNAASGGNGVQGISNATLGGAGVWGQSTSPTGSGVAGINSSTSGYGNGVYGQSNSPAGYGVYGANNAGVAVAGTNQTCSSAGCTLVVGTAGQFSTAVGGTILSGIGGSYGNQVFYVDASGNGYFAGNLNVTGKVTKGSGSFKIDHPLDPANKYLSHSFVESPDMKDVYDGVARLDTKGEAWVDLPDYFEALNGEFRYQLTAIGAPAPRLYVAREVSQNRFKIAGGRPGGRVSWQVTGIRHDAYANAHRIPVTEDKPAAEQGSYLHPDVYGQSGGTQNLVRTNPSPGRNDSGEETSRSR